MGILDEIRSESVGNKKCGVGAFLKGLDTKTRAEWEDALANTSHQHAPITRVMKTAGAHVSVDMVARHRRKVCSCGD